MVSLLMSKMEKKLGFGTNGYYPKLILQASITISVLIINNRVIFQKYLEILNLHDCGW